MSKKYQPKLRGITRLGNPILRQKARRLTKEEILSDEIQHLIADIRYTLEKTKSGVGLAAPQVGESVALSVIGIKPTPNHPDLETFDMVIINPKIVRGIGAKKPMWEGCCSVGPISRDDDILWAEVPRYEKIELSWLDADAKEHREILSGFPAHVAQHETNHLNGIIFVDLADPQTFMMGSEYKQRVVKGKD